VALPIGRGGRLRSGGASGVDARQIAKKCRASTLLKRDGATRWRAGSDFGRTVATFDMRVKEQAI
jgi:hypothetical protein